MSWIDRLDALGEHLSRHALGWLCPLLYGTSVGSAAWWLSHPAVVASVGTNRLEASLRNSAATWVFLAICVLYVGYVAAHALVRRKQGQWPGLELTKRLNRWLLPCLSGAPLVALLQRGIEEKRPFLCIALLVFTALVWAIPFYDLPLGRLWPWRKPSAATATTATASEATSNEATASEATANAVIPNEGVTPKGSRWAPLLVGFLLTALWIGYSVFFSRLAILNHHNLYTATFDLGLYDNIFFQTLRGKLLGCSFLANNYHGAAHFDPILILLSPLYLLYPRAECLLVLQSFWMGAGLFPVYLIARRQLGCRWQALPIASMWLLYPALQGANMYDFHSLSLAAPVLVWFFWFRSIESFWGYWLSFVAAILVREDVPLLLCFIAFAGIRMRTPFLVRQGWLTIVLSLAYFVLVKAFFMGAPEKVLSGTQTYSFAYYYAELIPNGRGLREMFTSLFTNPPFALQLSTSWEKVQFVLLLFVPLGFLPFLARSGRFAFFYGFFFCLLATRAPVYSIYFQYTVPLFAVGFSLLPEGLLTLERSRAVQSFGLQPLRLRRAFLVGMFLVTALVSLKFGGFIENSAFRGGFNPPRRHLDDRGRARYEWVRKVIDSLPADAAVGASRRLGPHISNRAKAYDYPGTRKYDYIFIDEIQLDEKQKRTHEQFIKEQRFVQVDKHGTVVLFKRAGL